LQGHSLFHNTHELEEFTGLVGEAAEGGGDFVVAGTAEEADGGVAESGEDLGGGAAPDLALIFAKGHVADPVQAIFDPPVPAPGPVQLSGSGPGTGHAGHGVLHLLGGLAPMLGAMLGGESETGTFWNQKRGHSEFFHTG
jgi:hypothetical protein